MEALLEGFNEIIEPELVSIFDAQELELLISGIYLIIIIIIIVIMILIIITLGLPDIDIDDMRNNTTYSGYKGTSVIIIIISSILRQ